MEEIGWLTCTLNVPFTWSSVALLTTAEDQESTSRRTVVSFSNKWVYSRPLQHAVGNTPGEPKVFHWLTALTAFLKWATQWLRVGLTLLK